MESYRGQPQSISERYTAELRGTAMYEIKFFVSENTLDRLFALKEREGKHNLTGNEFAAELLEEILRERQPFLPTEND